VPRLSSGRSQVAKQDVVVFINHNKDDVVAGSRLRALRICSVLQMAPSTYYAVNGRPASARQLRDVEIAHQLIEIWEANYSVYGVRAFPELVSGRRPPAFLCVEATRGGEFQ
jgi:5'(3')-deoxyribonucleotidase